MTHHFSFAIGIVKFIFFILFFLSLQANEFDAEYWQYFTLKNFEKGPYRLYSSGEFRMDRDASTLYHYRITENFAYKATSWLDLEAHYSFIRTKPIETRMFHHTHRLELEINPSLQLNDRVVIKWRNRLQIQKRQNNPRIEYIFRHRIMLVFPLENWGKLTEIKCYDELFYHCHSHHFTQNRFFPIEMTFKFKKTYLNIFIMLRRFATQATRTRLSSVCLGSEVGF